MRYVERVSAQCYESKVQTCKSLNILHIADRYTYFKCIFPVLKTFEVKHL